MYDPASYPPPVVRTADPDGLAIASLIFGVVPIVPVAGSILAIIFGASSRSKAKREGLRPHPMSAWGIGLGILALIITVIVVIALVASHSTSPEQAYVNCLNNALTNGTSAFACTPPPGQ